MKALDHISVGAKLMLAPVTMIALLAVLSASFFYGLRQQQLALDNIVQVRLVNFQLASESATKSQETYAGTYRLVSAIAAGFPPNRLEAMSKELLTGLATIDQRLADLRKASTVVAEEAEILDKLDKQLAAYRKSTQDVIDVSMVDFSTAMSVVTVAQKDFTALCNLLNELLAIEQRLSKEAYQQAQATSHWVVAMVVGVLALSVVLALTVGLLVRADIVSSIATIKSAALSLKNGDLTQRVRVQGRDEIAETALAFNELIDSFQGAVRKVHAAVGAVSGASKELLAGAGTVVTGSTRQADAASAVAATMQEMAVSISSVAANGQMVKDISRQSLDNTIAGSSSLERLTSDTALMRTAFSGITTSIGEFVQSTRSITDMTRQVKELAEQTNLLALNAAIEAARAGEQGRGFAVVADEVRKLAERSSEAANSIDALTKGLEHQSVAVEESLGVGTTSLGSSEAHMAELESMISAARSSMTAADSGVDEIARAVKEQSTASNDIAARIDEIARMVEENDGAIRQVSAASGQLGIHAEGLQQAVSQFRV
jgi:methyl-accepting chemotaxis protein